jgi:hypothetical protein
MPKSYTHGGPSTGIKAGANSYVAGATPGSGQSKNGSSKKAAPPSGGSAIGGSRHIVTSYKTMSS